MNLMPPVNWNSLRRLHALAEKESLDRRLDSRTWKQQPLLLWRCSSSSFWFWEWELAAQRKVALSSDRDRLVLIHKRRICLRDVWYVPENEEPTHISEIIKGNSNTARKTIVSRVCSRFAKSQSVFLSLCYGLVFVAQSPQLKIITAKNKTTLCCTVSHIYVLWGFGLPFFTGRHNHAGPASAAYGYIYTVIIYTFHYTFAGLIRSFFSPGGSKLRAVPLIFKARCRQKILCPPPRKKRQHLFQ